jgi:hypothetical protein
VVQMDSGTKIDAMTLVGSVILTVTTIIASWPAIVFVIIYYTDHNTGTLIVGGLMFFACSCTVGFSGLGLVKDSQNSREASCPGRPVIVNSYTLSPKS